MMMRMGAGLSLLSSVSVKSTYTFSERDVLID